MQHRRSLSLALLALAAVSHADWDVNADFSTASNPNGAWSYGSTPTLGGAFTAFTEKEETPGGFYTWHGTTYDGFLPMAGKNLSSGTLYGVPAGDFSMHPGPSSLAVTRWTAPAAGTYTIDGLFKPGDFGGMDVHVQKNGVDLFTAENQGVFDLSAALQAGDHIDFVVGIGGFYGGSTPLEAKIAAVPEPASLFALGLGATALLRRRRA